MKTLLEFKTKKEAKAFANRMVGYETKVIKWLNAKGKEVFVIQCDEKHYLKDDGFVEFLG